MIKKIKINEMYNYKYEKLKNKLFKLDYIQIMPYISYIYKAKIQFI